MIDLGGGVPDGAHVGRTWPDVVAEHAGLGIVIAIAIVFAVGVIVVGLILWHLSSRAKAEGREIAVLWGLGSIGPQADERPPARKPESSNPPANERPNDRTGSNSGSFPSHPPNLDVFQRGALAVVRAAHEIAMARSQQDLEERELYLLTAVSRATNQATGVTRRASILKVHAERGDLVMRLHAGTPESLFRHPYASFSKADYTDRGEGLCWEAVHACQGAHEQDSIRRFIFNATDVTRERSFVAVRGHHPFKAILIAPIVHERSREVLGVLCLDSDAPDHYTAADQYLVSIAALALSVAWKARKTESH